MERHRHELIETWGFRVTVPVIFNVHITPTEDICTVKSQHDVGVEIVALLDFKQDNESNLALLLGRATSTSAAPFAADVS